MRSHPRRSAVLALLLTCAAGSCRQAEQKGDPEHLAAEVRIVDADGAEHVFAAPATRIVSLVPSVTEILHAIGAQGHLVGRTDFDEQVWARSIPSVGGGLEPSLEAIVALRPDVVVRFAGAQDPRTPSRLDDLGIPHVSVRPDRVDDIYGTVLLAGRLTGREADADSLVAAIRGALDEVARAVRGEPRVRVAYVLGGTPPWVAGPDTYISDVLSVAGADNAFSDLGGLYAPVSREELLSRELDLIMVGSLSSAPSSLPRGVRVEPVGELLELPGPRVAQAAREVARLLHGDSALRDGTAP